MSGPPAPMTGRERRHRLTCRTPSGSVVFSSTLPLVTERTSTLRIASDRQARRPRESYRAARRGPPGRDLAGAAAVVGDVHGIVDCRRR